MIRSGSSATAFEVAIAHVRWCREAFNMSAHEIGRSIGRNDVWTWDEAVRAVASAWGDLPVTQPEFHAWAARSEAQEGSLAAR